MVKPERYKLKPLSRGRTLARGIHSLTSQLLVEELERSASGKWYATATVRLVFEMNDGRTVTSFNKCRLAGSQQGKLPNPNAFGRRDNGNKEKKR